MVAIFKLMRKSLECVYSLLKPVKWGLNRLVTLITSCCHKNSPLSRSSQPHVQQAVATNTVAQNALVNQPNEPSTTLPKTVSAISTTTPSKTIVNATQQSTVELTPNNASTAAKTAAITTSTIITTPAAQPPAAQKPTHTTATTTYTTTASTATTTTTTITATAAPASTATQSNNKTVAASAAITSTIKKHLNISTTNLKQIKASERTFKEENEKQYELKEIMSEFANTNSSKLCVIVADQSIKYENRNHFKDNNWNSAPPLTARSSFVPDVMVKHLMTKRRGTAFKTKWLDGTEMTNMEGAMRTFMTPMAATLLVADKVWMGNNIKTVGLPFGNNVVRQVIMSDAVHPDFECEDPKRQVVMDIVGLSAEAVQGVKLDDKFSILESGIKKDKAEGTKQDEKARKAYDETLRKHMIYHLTSKHSLPSIGEVKADVTNKDYTILTPVEVKKLLSAMINPQNKSEIVQPSEITKQFQGKFVRAAKIVSLEALYNLYRQQIANEFSLFEKALPQGYIYTIDPPSIFVEKFGGDTAILNYLQILAIKHFAAENELKYLKAIAYNDFQKDGSLQLLQATTIRAEGNVVRVSMNTLYKNPMDKQERLYQGLPGCEGTALIIHNNSDAFGENIANEGECSLDGVIGYNSDAYRALHKTRNDLLVGLQPIKKEQPVTK